MRHRQRAGTLGRSASHRTAMYRNMVTSLLDRERIETTDAKAKAVRRLAERMITLGKRGDLHARRRALRIIRSRAVTAKVFEDLAERFRDRPGGYTRVIKLRTRVGDAAPMSIVELVEGEAAAKTTKKTAAKKGEKAAEAEKKAPRKKAAARKKAKSSDEGDSGAKKKTATKKTAKKKTAKKAATEKKTAKKKTAKKAGKTAGSKKTTKKK